MWVLWYKRVSERAEDIMMEFRQREAAKTCARHAKEAAHPAQNREGGRPGKNNTVVGES